MALTAEHSRYVMAQDKCDIQIKIIYFLSVWIPNTKGTIASVRWLW